MGAVVRPGSLVELWRVFNACVAADHIVIPQAANTGLTGGSTPDGTYDRPVVLINTLRIDNILPIKGGDQVVCLAGATLFELENRLARFGREPHSVIGSTCIGATVIGGVCNNSGGALVQRGPAYTEYALYAQVDENNEVHLRNRLGIRLAGSPEEILAALDEGKVSDADIDCEARLASAAAEYAQVVRAVNEPSPARFNADPRRLFEAAGSAGKLLIFAVRLDTFPVQKEGAIFYIGSNDTAELTEIRRCLLTSNMHLPIFGEYIHREAFDVASRFGKDTVLAIRSLGTKRLPALFRLKAWVDRLGQASRVLPRNLSDRLLQTVANLLPQHLPSRILAFRDRFEHHLILKVADDAIAPTRQMLLEIFPSASGDVFECSDAEGKAAMLHRFAVAGAAVRYRAIAPDLVEDVVAVDVALRRDDHTWFEQLPPDLDAQLVTKLYYGHFLCHVFHQDYLLKKGEDPVSFEHQVCRLLDQRGALYPAEHNVGRLYKATPDLADHYRRLDPSNCMNPGIGGMSRCRNYE